MDLKYINREVIPYLSDIIFPELLMGEYVHYYTDKHGFTTRANKDKSPNDNDFIPNIIVNIIPSEQIDKAKKYIELSNFSSTQLNYIFEKLDKTLAIFIKKHPENFVSYDRGNEVKFNLIEKEIKYKIQEIIEGYTNLKRQFNKPQQNETKVNTQTMRIKENPFDTHYLLTLEGYFYTLFIQNTKNEGEATIWNWINDITDLISQLPQPQKVIFIKHLQSESNTILRFTGKEYALFEKYFEPYLNRYIDFINSLNNIQQQTETKTEQPKTFEELFYNPEHAEPCLKILNELQPPVIDAINNYIGKAKGVFPLWVKVLKNHKPEPLIKHFKDTVYKDLLNQKVKGLNLTKDASEFRKQYKRLENDRIELDIKTILSQYSQSGKLGK